MSSEDEFELFENNDHGEQEAETDAEESSDPAADVEEPAAVPPADGEFTFETALEQLETIVAKMESGQLSLEDCMKYFEDGTRLAKYCAGRLEETEKKVELLLKKSGTVTWTPLDDQ